MGAPAQDYSALLQAIANYYSGTDKWIAIADYGMTGADAYTTLAQTPGVELTVAKNGEIMSYTVNELVGINSQPSTALINSNTQAATLSNPSRLYYPADMGISQGTGKVVAESGLKTVSSGSKVSAALGKVAVSVGAVATGIQLGAVIDGALYNANPDFWDSIGMSSLNPETWDSLCSTQEGKDVFNMVFGINKDNGTTQAYMDENAFAYIAQYMASQGAFSDGGTSSQVDQSELWDRSADYNQPIPFKSVHLGDIIEYLPNSDFDRTILALEATSDVRCYLGITQNSQSYILVSKETFSIHIDGVSSRVNSTVSYNGVRYYFYEFTPSSEGVVNVPTYENDYSILYRNIYNSWDVAHIVCDGTVIESPTIEGISKQDGGTFPTGITPEMTLPEVLAELQRQFPQIFEDGLYNDVIQPDGTVKRYNYVPVQIPEQLLSPELQLDPTGGIQTQQGIDPITDQVPESVLDKLLDLILNPDPYTPTKPSDTKDTPDTGTGTTPTIVVPVGSAGALYTIYNPTQAELNSFGGWLWSSNFVDQLLKLFNDPMQAIIGLHKVFATPEISGTGTIKVGYLDSGVSSKLVGSQYVTVDCGEVSLYEFFGNVFDYAPFTKVYIYLPFIGIMQIDTGEVMRGTIGVVYHVDVLTGACLAEVKVTRDNAGGTLYTYTGNCACQYPISSGSYMGIVASLASVVGGIIGTVASGGALAPVAMGAVSGVLNAHTDVSHSGGFSGNAGAMGIKKPYLIIRRPQTALAENFQKFSGKPSNHYTLLSSCTGYVKCLDCHLEGIPATGEELAELDDLLKSGIII